MTTPAELQKVEATGIRVEIGLETFIHAPNEDMLQFMVRQKLRSAGIPLGPWGTSKVERGVMSWWTDPMTGTRIVTWRDDSTEVEAQ